MTFNAGSMGWMRATWALVLVLPWQAYALELWLAQRLLDPSEPQNPYRIVERVGVGPALAASTLFALVVACAVPRLVHRRAMDRLRGRARPTPDPDRDGTYRSAPVVLRFPDEGAARRAVYSRYAGRLAGTLAVIAGVELALFFAMMTTNNFSCFGGGRTMFVPNALDYGPLLGIVALVAALEIPRHGAAVQRIRDLFDTHPPRERPSDPVHVR